MLNRTSVSGSVRKGRDPGVAFICVHGPGCRRGEAGKGRCKGGEWKVRCSTLDRDIEASQRGCRPKTGTARQSFPQVGLHPDPRNHVSIDGMSIDMFYEYALIHSDKSQESVGCPFSHRHTGLLWRRTRGGTPGANTNTYADPDADPGQGQHSADHYPGRSRV